ncbi:SAF domain-containing protein [Nocardioides sp. cx-173]|uniref:SAF domain-containing protein n=1 Tax=Nocardioides sp. cx-173 TaxID=2898796 RepID=UPI001E58BD86|nr:SAF domain-containing protein [Nocardioides sp. cx-173]MCD4526860.1 SAF domain-containing protein [Nocardioides sp. cx-173]UGB41351.1 SAF domain-containing protein [Nocardioides sp. cx-173]
MDSSSADRPGRARLGDGLRQARRAVLRRRRPLAALLVAVAVAAGLHAATAPPPATVEVPVAAHDLAAGTVLDGQDLVRVAFAPKSVPDDLAEDPVGRTLAGPLRRGEPLTAVRLVGPALTDGRPDLVATPVRLPDPGMVGLLSVGDRIDLVAADPQAGDAEVVARDVPVLALPADDGAAAASGLPGRLVVVGADPSEVGALTAAAVRTVVTFTWTQG